MHEGLISSSKRSSGGRRGGGREARLTNHFAAELAQASCGRGEGRQRFMQQKTAPSIPALSRRSLQASKVLSRVTARR